MGAGEIEEIPGHPWVARLLAPNPGPMTLEGTNTYLVDNPGGGVLVVDPGPDAEGHVEALRRAGERRGGIAGVVLTHSHADHSAAVASLGAPLLLGEVGNADESSAESGAAADEAGWPPDPPERVGPFAVLPTPGHAIDHVCLLVADGGGNGSGAVLFCGDLILGHGSSFLPPDGGSLAAYMESLQKLQTLELELMLPGHGPAIDDPQAKIEQYLEHRRERERKLLAALGEGERSRAALLAQAWDDVDEVLRPAAAIVMEAHLEKLEADGKLDEIELTE